MNKRMLRKSAVGSPEKVKVLTSKPSLTLDSIGPEGGPYCRHLDSEEECRSFDATCRKLYKYLLGEKAGPS
jgi:hypothetical protein